MGHVIRFSACPPSGRRGPPPSLYKHAGGKKNKVNVTKALPAPAQGTDPGVRIHGTNVFTINSQAFLVMLLLLLRIVQVLDETKWARECLRTAADGTFLRKCVRRFLARWSVCPARVASSVLLAFKKPVYKGPLIL